MEEKEIWMVLDDVEICYETMIAQVEEVAEVAEVVAEMDVADSVVCFDAPSRLLTNYHSARGQTSNQCIQIHYSWVCNKNSI